MPIFDWYLVLNFEQLQKLTVMRQYLSICKKKKKNKTCQICQRYQLMQLLEFVKNLNSKLFDLAELNSRKI